MKIYLIRHGDVENPKHILYGRLPGFHLSAKGIAETMQTAEKLKRLNAKISKIYTSPLERATETANIIAENLKISKDNIIVDERLTEAAMGKWQGIKLSKLHKQYNMMRKENGFGDPKETGQRVLDVVNDITKNNFDCAIISHWDPIMAAISLLKNDWKLFETSYIKTGEYIVIDNTNGKWEIIK